MRILGLVPMIMFAAGGSDSSVLHVAGGAFMWSWKLCVLVCLYVRRMPDSTMDSMTVVPPGGVLLDYLCACRDLQCASK